MTRKHTKRALFTSALVLLLCISMLVGTTFAWFTDSVTSGQNTIQSGNLDIVLEYSKDMSTWNTVEGATELVDKTALWEPGHTEVVYLRITNAGTLALSYNFSMNFTDTVVGTSVLGGDIKLSEHLMYGVVDVTTKYNDRTEARNAVANSAAPLTSYHANDSQMLAGEVKTVALVVYMPESVGNEANYRGDKIPQIDMGINLYATQTPYETDSYGSDYDQITVVTNAADLMAALADGENVMLGADITVNAAEPITVAAGTSASLDLAGFSITGASTEAKAAYVIDNKGTLTINDSIGTGSIELTNAVVSTGNAYATDAILNSGNLTINGGTIQNNLGGASYAIDNNVGGVTTINGGRVINTAGSAIRVYSWDANTASTLVINGGYVEGTYAVRLQNLSDTAACKVDVTINGGTLKATDSTYNMALYSYCNNGSNFTVTLNAGTYYGDVAFGGGTKAGQENVTVNDNCNIIGDVYRYTSGGVVDIKTTNKVAADTVAEINAGTQNGGNVVLIEDVTAPLTSSAFYGTPVAVIQKGGTFDGNGNSLDIENPQYNGYAIETYGGTITNLTIDSTVGRGIVISAPSEDVYINNVVVDGPGYALNTTEHNGKNLIVTNSTFKGWSSFAGLDSASFTNCTFGENTSKYWQDMGYDQDYDRVIRPYVNATFTGCVFEKDFYIDLSALGEGCTITLDSCTTNGIVITAENYDTYIEIELPSGRSLADCVTFK